MQIEPIDVDLTDALRTDAACGLTDTSKWLPSEWFYDARDSELFERITELPEYYPTRIERALLRQGAGEIAHGKPGRVSQSAVQPVAKLRAAKFFERSAQHRNDSHTRSSWGSPILRMTRSNPRLER